MKYNHWHFERDENDNPFTATFADDDFERWWQEGRDESDEITTDDQNEIFEAMLYIAESEGREITQDESELRTAIDVFATQWNNNIR